MFDLLKPEIRVESEGLDYVHIVAEPLEKGFGNTVGNALRRVLLASLPGAAITSVRIDGIDHEFSTKDGMKEDMTEFLLNLAEHNQDWGQAAKLVKALEKVKNEADITRLARFKVYEGCLLYTSPSPRD